MPVGLRHLRVRAAGVRRDGAGVLVTADDGQVHRADAVVLATGERPPGAGWAPAALRDSAFFVPDPWAPGALDVVRRDAAGPADVLLVGTGLTMVDVVLARSPAPTVVPTAGSTPSPATASCRAAMPASSSWPRSPRSTTGVTPSRTTVSAPPSTSPASSAPPATGDPRWTDCEPSSRRCGSASTRASVRSSSASTPATGDGYVTGCLRSRPTWSPLSSVRWC